jgi:hypothetical protein
MKSQKRALQYVYVVLSVLCDMVSATKRVYFYNVATQLRPKWRMKDEKNRTTWKLKPVASNTPYLEWN